MRRFLYFSGSHRRRLTTSKIWRGHENSQIRRHDFTVGHVLRFHWLLFHPGSCGVCIRIRHWLPVLYNLLSVYKEIYGQVFECEKDHQGLNEQIHARNDN